jgi:hypothetical protein
LKEDLNADAERKTVFEKLSDRVIRSLQRKYVNAQYASNTTEALSVLLDMIPEGATVGTADSMTLLQVGILSTLKRRGQNELINPFTRNDQGKLIFDQPERVRQMRRIFSSDIYLIGTNAITLDGKLVNTDGFGNRVSAMIFGPEKVIIVVGANKIVKDIDEALQRIRTVCAPINAVRHATKHQAEQFKSLPCVKTGICADCNEPHRICHYTTIIEGEQQRRQGHINVVIIGESLGI